MDDHLRAALWSLPGVTLYQGFRLVTALSAANDLARTLHRKALLEFSLAVSCSPPCIAGLAPWVIAMAPADTPLPAVAVMLGLSFGWAWPMIEGLGKAELRARFSAAIDAFVAALRSPKPTETPRGAP